MIEFITGVPGSGKSYRGIFSLYTNFGKDKSEIKDKSLIHIDVSHALTNINEIKLDKFEDDKVKQLDWDIFYNALTQLHVLYKAKTTDTEMLPIAENLGLKDVLIILDECHNYLDRQDAVLTWWLSYHRHFHQQIYLITQNLALVHAKYKAFSEFFYVARPSSLKLFKNKMNYFQYTNSRLSQKSKSGTIKIPVVKEVFDSYGSGANQQSKSLLKKYLILAISFFFLLAIGIYAIRIYITPSNVSDNRTSILKKKENTTATLKYKSKSTEISNDLIPYLIYCKKTMCMIENQLYTYKYLKFLIENYEIKLISTNQATDSNFNKFYMFISESNYKKFFTVRSKKDETKTDNNTALPKLF